MSASVKPTNLEGQGPCICTYRHVHSSVQNSCTDGGARAAWAGLVVQQEPQNELRLKTRMVFFLLVKATRSEQMCPDDGWAQREKMQPLP